MKILKIDLDTLASVLQEVLRVLRKGGVVVCPTDTVYGFLADATNRKAVQKVFQIKKREHIKPLPVFVKDIQMAKRLALISRTQERFLQKVWPGKVTAVLQSKHVLGKGFEQEGKIGLRIPNHSLARELLGRFKRPLTGTSANISGASSCRDAREVVAQFRQRKYQPDLILDEGKLPFSRSSTVVDITKRKKKIIRV